MTDIIIGKIKFVPLSKSRYFIREASQFTVFYWPASSRIIVSAREVIRFLVPKIAQIISGLLATLLPLPARESSAVISNRWVSHFDNFDEKIILPGIRQMYNNCISMWQIDCHGGCLCTYICEAEIGDS